MNSAIASLPILIVNAHSRCNCRCTMCDIWRTTASEDFSLDRLQAQLGDIERLGVQWVVFSGGEPLMHSDLFPLVRTLQARGIKTTILSTGLLLERYASQIAGGVDEVIVSLDGPEAVHDEIRRTPGCFQAIRRGVCALRSHRSGFPVRARSTVQRANHHCLLETVAAARELSLTSLSFLAADVTSTAFGRNLAWPDERQASVRLTPQQTETLRDQIEELIRAGDGFVSDTPRHLRRIVAHFRALLGLEEFEAPRCNAPWVSAVLEPDGALRPCFFHPVVGSLAGGGLAAALNGPSAKAFRQNLNIAADRVCRRCVCSVHYAQD